MITPSLIDIEMELQWQKVIQFLQNNFDKNEIDLEAMLMLIGIQEVGLIRSKYSKEQKQDLMHVAVCTLLQHEDCFVYSHQDEDGWPHYKALERTTLLTGDEQDYLLRKQIILYFQNHIK